MAEELLNVKVPHIINPVKDGIFDIPILHYSMPVPACHCEARAGRYKAKNTKPQKTYLISVSCRNSETFN